MKLTGAQIMAEVLIEQGADTVFGYPGGAVLNIYDALYEYRDKIRHIMTAHEQGAAHAADGFARATGKTGVVIATSGPGATNLVTGIATAYMDSVPMVAITGNVSTDLIGKDSFQEIYIAGVTIPITKHNFMIRSVEELAPTLRAAFEIAQSGRKGPVLVDIPKDITAAVTEFEPQTKKEHTRALPEAGEEELRAVAEMINQSERPAIYFGGGVAAADAGAALLALMNKASIPATRTLMASGVLSYDEPKNLGLLGMHGSRTANLVVDEADLVLALGTRFSDRVALNTDAFARNAKIVQIDIDQSEINKNVEVSLGVVGDIGHALERLLPMVEEKHHPQWWRIIADSQAADYTPEDDDTVLKPHQVIGKICELAGEDSIIATDVGQHQMWAAQYCKRVKTRSFLTSGGLGTMGYGYGAALGAQVAFPDRPVIHITGDGSFHMNMNECCTAVSYNLPVITVIMNNTVLGMVRQWQAAFYGQRYYSTSPERKTNYQKVAEGFGAKGYRVQNLQEFEQAFRQALAERRPCWIECPIDKDERVLPMIPPGQTIDDIIMD